MNNKEEIKTAFETCMWLRNEMCSRKATRLENKGVFVKEQYYTSEYLAWSVLSPGHPEWRRCS